MIPGQNLLKTAFSVIAKQTISYYKFKKRVLNDEGIEVAEYNEPVDLKGSFQSVPRRLYQIYGLDLQKSYYTFYAPADILDLQRDVSGDQIAFDSYRYQCESDNDWYAMDGWVGVLCVRIGVDIPPEPIPISS